MSDKQKEGRLRERIRSLGSALVAFSGGVDSTLLLRVAHDELGEGAVGLTATGPSYGEGELAKARELAGLIGARQVVVESGEMGEPGFVRNGPDRCYFCKTALFRLCQAEAARLGLKSVLDGSNRDDLGDHRPGLQAARELGVVQPFLELGLGKAEIRALARELGLPNWDRPAMACLASRFPYGMAITAEELAKVGRAEQGLAELGFEGARVRNHGTVARIEVPVSELERVLSLREEVVLAVRGAGFVYVALDMEGYRTGSLNTF